MEKGEHGLYGMFWPDETTGETLWYIERNKRHALRAMRRLKGTVYAVGLSYGAVSWDGPTFRAVGDLIADYRVTP